MVRRTTKVGISVLQHNAEVRQFKKLLIIGSGGFVSHNTWERICMEMQEALHDDSINIRYAFLPSDTTAARAAYQDLIRASDFDAVLNFTANGTGTLNGTQPRYNTVGLIFVNGRWVAAGPNYNLNNPDRDRRLISAQAWDLVLFVPSDTGVIWQAQMYTQVVETERKSYRKVSNEILAALQADQLIAADDKNKKHAK